MSHTPSPFKFLEPFTFADRKNFFGRDKEVETLYRVVQRTPLLLLYGLSGTGKTSLVQCGLAARFDGPDWLPLWVRREDDLVRSLHKQIDAAFTAPMPAGAGAPEKIQALYRQYLRPVFLMFDQFEELFILGDLSERNAFVGEIKNILKAGLPCTILLIIREEYLGRLYPLEKDIPNLFDFRMRVEPMDTANVTKVLTDSFANFNIRLEAPAEARIGEIITNIRLKDTPVELPHLQVYLDRLYREDFARTYPNGATTSEGAWPPLEFTKAEIAEFGTIENVLDKFLQEQRALIQEKFEKAFPDESGIEYAVDRVLAAFVSAEGTKRPISVTEEAGGLVIAPRQRDLFPALSPEALSWCIKQLAQSRILHSSGASYELTHDTLATAVERQQNAEQKQLSEARHRIELGYKNHLDTNGQSFIDQAMLFRLEPLLPKLDLPEEWEEFVENSFKEVKRLADLENERQRQERERILRDKRRNLVVGLLALALLGFAFWQMRTAAEAKKQAKTEQINADQAKREAADATENAEQKTIAADEADKRAKRSEEIAALEQKKARTEQENARLIQLKAERAAEQAVVALIDAARRDILQLHYDDAFSKMKNAAGLGSVKDSVAFELMEIAFFRYHAGQPAQATEPLSMAAKLLGKSGISQKNDIGDALVALDKGRDSLIKARYFPVMLELEGGAYQMQGEHETNVQGFRMAQTETTVWQYYLFCLANGRDITQRIGPDGKTLDKDKYQPSWGWIGDNPVVYVNWYDAVEYANWLSQKLNRSPVYTIKPEEKDSLNTNVSDDFEWTVTLHENARGYRLPTEAEWEYAARGGVRRDTFTYSGSNKIDEVAWYGDNADSRTQAVRVKKSNGAGLYDMSGNVWEWCFDWYGESLPAETAWGPKSGSFRVLRGGSWYSGAEYCQVSHRNYDSPDLRYNYRGFRLVLVP